MAALELAGRLAKIARMRHRRRRRILRHGQIREREQLAGAEHHGPLERVLQLPHIALPRPRGERPQRLALDAEEPRPELGIEPPDQVIDQQWNIPAALAQRRHLELHDVEPKEQVLAKAPAEDLARQIPIGARDDADVDRRRPRAADGPHEPVLHYAEELDLEGQG